MFLFFFFLLLPCATVSAHNRRVLHQPFFPVVVTQPPSEPPILSPPAPTTTPQYPFQPSTPPENANNPFFPTYPSPPRPPPPTPTPPSTSLSFPANISSIDLPNTTKPKHINKLIITALSSVIAAAIVLVLVIFLHVRKRRRYPSNDSKTQSQDNHRIPKLERPSQTSSEFLYLGTLVNSHGGIEQHSRSNSSNPNSAPATRKIGSPELRPLPPLTGRNSSQNHGNARVFSGVAQNDVDFYSSAGSIGAGSLSRRDFGAVESEKFAGSSSSGTSSSSGSGSPNRSLSLSISPPASLSPERPKSPELVAFPPPQYPPPPPPPPPPAAIESPSQSPPSSENEMVKPKLKTLHWDKVRASSDHQMVWDQLKSSSFKLNEEMMETLFVMNTSALNTNQTARGPVLRPSSGQENRVLDPKKSQNIAILLRALNVTIEEVSEALLEGNAETLGSELLESLLKMAPSKEEERKLKENKDDSPYKLGQAEKFLKAILDIPFAFKRVEAMLYMSNFDNEVDYLSKSFETLEVACEELRSGRMFLKLLQAVLKTGNRMNVGTNKGDAHAFKLDTLLKLVDVKGADRKTTLLHFVVQEIIKSEGARLSGGNLDQRKLGLQGVSNISSELINVKKAAAMDSEMLHTDVLKLSKGIRYLSEVVGSTESTTNKFCESMNRFMEVAEEKIIRLQAQETVAMSLVKEITEYFHGDSAREEAHPFRIFMVVKDFLMILDRVCKEVGIINERTIISSTTKFPLPVNPNLQPVVREYTGKRQHSSSDEESSSP